jgi:PAS domain S-box-containing protein
MGSQPETSSSRSSPARRDYRLLGRRLDRLTTRIAIGIAMLVIGPLSIGFYALSTHHVDQTLEVQSRAADLQTRILEAALRHQMIDQDTSLMASVLAEVSAESKVRSAMILNHEGEIRISSEPDLVGRKIPRESPTCFVCHSKSGAERERWVLVDKGEQEVLRSVLPIENGPECFACHSPDERLNGILIVDTSMAELRAEHRRDVFWFVAGTAFLALLLLGGVGLLLRRLVLVRLARLGRAARSIAAGNLSDRAQVDGDDVITSLAHDFNDMADTVSRLVAEVQEQEAQLANIVNSLDDGLVVLDRDARVVASNLSFCKRLGSHPESVRGRSCHESTDGALPCCTSDVECPAARCMATGKVQRAVFQSETAGGEAGRVEEVCASPVLDDEGQVTRVVEVWRDISERVQEEQRLAEIERLVSLGTLASGFSHEVNTPLASILTCAESVLARIDDRGETGEDVLPAVRESAEIVRDQVLRCRKITEQFLRFSRGIPPSVEPIDLTRVVAGVVSLVEPTARELGVSLRVARGGPLPAVRANAEVVQHVVLNVLVNAVQSCEGRGGAVEVRFVVGEEVCIRVRDEGCGVAPRSRAHLFEPFQSEKPTGTGLGLFLSRSFMRRFGGDVRLVESELGVGSCFEIVLERERVHAS